MKDKVRERGRQIEGKILSKSGKGEGKKAKKCLEKKKEDLD